MRGKLVPSMVPSIFHSGCSKNSMRLRYNYFYFIDMKTGSEKMSFVQDMQLKVEPGLTSLSGHQRLALTTYNYKPLNRHSVVRDSIQLQGRTRMVKETSAQQ